MRTEQHIDSGSIGGSMNLQINPALGIYCTIQRQGDFSGRRSRICSTCFATGQYKKIHAGVIHDGEIRGVNPLTGEFIIGEKISEEIIGYVAHLELVNGFSKTLYMTKAEIENHAQEYSQSYKSDSCSIKT